MKELKKNHTGFYLKAVLDEVIEQYGIMSNSIYSNTTDDGANMLKYVCLFSEEDITERTGNAELPSCSSWQSDAEELSSDEDNSGTVNCINVEVLLGNLSSSHISTAQAENMWKGIRCAANILQLSVEDALKKSSLRDVIDSTRCICKKLRNPSVLVLLKKLKLRKPLLDNPTRWHSTYDILQRLLLLKDFCLDMVAATRTCTYQKLLGIYFPCFLKYWSLLKWQRSRRSTSNLLLVIFLSFG